MLQTIKTAFVGLYATLSVHGIHGRDMLNLKDVVSSVTNTKQPDKFAMIMIYCRQATVSW